MKKNFKFAAIAALAFGAAGYVAADSLDVDPAAAMGGTSQGLEVTHDNSSIAYVQDDTPNNEKVYRAEFLFNPNDIQLSAAANWRNTIFTAIGANPNPGGGLCGVGAFISSFRIFLTNTGGTGQDCNIQAVARGNLCGEAATLPRTSISCNSPAKVCVEYEAGGPASPGGSGFIRLASVAEGAACPPSGDAAYTERAVNNNINTSVELVRMGTPQTNAFGAGENGTMHFDEFASFRTLAP